MEVLLICFTIAGVKKIVRYIYDFVIVRFLISRFLCTVCLSNGKRFPWLHSRI